MILKAVKYRLYPSDEQCVLIDRHIGASRFVYNLALETKKNAYASAQVNLSCFDLIKQLPELKKECEWLKEINSQTLQGCITNMDSAFTNFFKGQSEFPKFKSKHKSRLSFSVPQNVIIEDNLIIIPKFKKGIKAVTHRIIEGKPKSATVSKTPTGKYFISILIETEGELPVKPTVTSDNTIGIDLGIKDFLITSEGEKIANPKHLKRSLSKLKYTQKKYSKYKGQRTKRKLALINEKVTNQRNDFLHKVSKKLIEDNQTIAIENLNVKGMVKNHKLAQSISDVAWGRFETFLRYKSDWYGSNILQIGRFEPSSKMSDCGEINKELKLSDRVWTCKKCGTTYDRDIQAANNIKKFALRNYIVQGTSTKNRQELPTLVGALTGEAPTL
jgi:putative transposase